MKSLLFKKIDAFTDGRSCGNPAGAVYADTDITDGEMQRIAYELRGFVSETVFVFPPDDGTHDYRLRYFSCEREVPFCGHGTIAVMYDLLSRDASASQFVRISTMKGILTVENRIADENAVYIAAPEPAYFDNGFDTEELACAMNLSPDRISASRPVTMVNAGQNVLIIPLETIDDVTGASPDYETIRAHCLAHNAEVINIWTPDTQHRANRYRTRVFAPTFGYLEDPATGSGNAALAYHLKQSGEWDGTPFSIEQGADRVNPNIIKVIWKDDRVYFGGCAMVKIEGNYFL
ncbi:MAG TPA: PhzF family phenazine biosynthesis protein [Spirochaetota bacterium]|nr:PhzF family phenazine biosynthesis protein [Spirochaetota bacterium]